MVEWVDLLRRRHWPWRVDAWPFAILYAAWGFAVVPSIDFTDALIVLGVISASHVLVFLFTAWSVDFRCFVQFSKVFSATDFFGFCFRFDFDLFMLFAALQGQ